MKTSIKLSPLYAKQCFQLHQWVIESISDKERSSIIKRIKKLEGKHLAFSPKGSWWNQSTYTQFLLKKLSCLSERPYLSYVLAPITPKLAESPYCDFYEFYQSYKADSSDATEPALKLFQSLFANRSYTQREYMDLITFVSTIGFLPFVASFLYDPFEGPAPMSLDTIALECSDERLKKHLDKLKKEKTDDDDLAEDEQDETLEDESKDRQAPKDEKKAESSLTTTEKDHEQTLEATPAEMPVIDSIEASNPWPVPNDQISVLPRTFKRQEKKTIPHLKEGYTRYFGYTANNNVGFANFYLSMEWIKDRFIPLTHEYSKDLFPCWGAFTLKLGNRRGPKEGGLLVIDINSNDISDNYDDKAKPRTDYVKCVSYEAIDLDKRVVPASHHGIHMVVRPTDEGQELDFSKNIPVHVTLNPETDESLFNAAGEKVLLFKDNVFYGPVRLKETSTKQAYVTFADTDNRGILKAYSGSEKDLKEVTEFVYGAHIGPSRINLHHVSIHDLSPIYADIWSDETLLTQLSKSHQGLEGDALLTSIIQSENLLSDERDIIDARLARLKKILNEAAYSVSLRAHLAKFLCLDVFSNDHGLMDALIEHIASDPELSKAFISNTDIGERYQSLETSLKELERTYREKEKNIASFHAVRERKEKEIQTLDGKIARHEETLKLLGDNADQLAALKHLDEIYAQNVAKKDRLLKLQQAILKEIEKASEKAPCHAQEFLPENLTQAVDVWEHETDEAILNALAKRLSNLSYQGPTARALVQSLVRYVQTYRDYDENLIINLFLCFTQNFLTVFAGEPGSGKTSICRILADALGLSTLDRQHAFDDLLEAQSSTDRFLTVPVEYGWTTKRDFIGYLNPLTNRFESSDPERWAFIRRLDAEARSSEGSRYPALMLLDEANLSPMEYYWSDWLRLCDQQERTSAITLWDKSPSMIPETMRFVATINNDSTTEALSQRLIDRACVITLPLFEGNFHEKTTPRKDQPLVPWCELESLFGARAMSEHESDIRALLGQIREKGQQAGIRVSARSRHQIEGYIGAATLVFSNREKPAWIEAVDFAVLQKYLPRINGTGEDYKTHLEALLAVLEAGQLTRSAERLREIIAAGSDAMDCFSFF